MLNCIFTAIDLFTTLLRSFLWTLTQWPFPLEAEKGLEKAPME